MWGPPSSPSRARASARGSPSTPWGFAKHLSKRSAGPRSSPLSPGSRPGTPTGASVHERLAQATNLLDIGRSVDYYRRYQHTADMITEADLDGFSHRKLALLSAGWPHTGGQGV